MNHRDVNLFLSELVTGMEISFKIGYKELIETFEDTYNINTATVHTFLRILSKIPDTFIARKIGLKKTSNIRTAVEMGVNSIIWISKKAEEILRGKKLDDKLLEESGQTASSESSPIDDARGSADYRRKLVAVLTKRAVQEAIKRV